MALLGFALIWIAFLLLAMPNIKIPFITVLGRNTFPVFVLHGFILRLELKYGIYKYSEIENLLLAVALSFVIIVLLGNPLWEKIFTNIREK